MKLIGIFSFLILIQKIYLIPDYCSLRKSPKGPNDCVLLSTNGNKCCFNPNNTEQCFNANSGAKGLLCDIDYFYGYMLGKKNYDNYKDKHGYCTFIYGDIKGALNYTNKIQDELNINELDGLEIHCLKSNYIKIKSFFLIFLFVELCLNFI